VQLDGLLATRFWGFCFDSNLTISDDWDPATTAARRSPGDASLIGPVALLMPLHTWVSAPESRIKLSQIAITVAIRGGECR
jgi:hypothetical protein